MKQPMMGLPVATVAPTAPGPGSGTRLPATVARPSATVVTLRPQARRLSKANALLLVQGEIARHGSIPSQDTVADRCQVNKATVSRWLRQWERDGLISRAQDGRCKVVASA